jgi:putative toxin-antitoxin system antitoxin component (TIGR02293 family)
MELSALAKVLGGKKVLRRNLRNRMDLVDLSNEGLTKDALLHLAKYFSCSVNQITQLLPVTERTIQRYKSEKLLNRIVSEQILQIAEVAAKGSEVFESKDRFLVWMSHPNTALNNKTPMSLLNSKFGADMVLDELGRIEHGVFS